MTETLQAARTSFTRLKAAWRASDGETRWIIALQLTSVLCMALAVILAFGWPGVLFCFSFGLWRLTR